MTQGEAGSDDHLVMRCAFAWTRNVLEDSLAFHFVTRTISTLNAARFEII